jgi:hypothetical protein
MIALTIHNSVADFGGVRLDMLFGPPARSIATQRDVLSLPSVAGYVNAHINATRMKHCASRDHWQKFQSLPKTWACRRRATLRRVEIDQ